MAITITKGVAAGPGVQEPIDCGKSTQLFAEPPDTIIIHYTAGSSALSSVNWLKKPDVIASAHVVIGEGGEIYQMLPFNKIAWHAGESSYGGRTGFNKYSIGIELANPGYLLQTGDEFVAPFGTRYPANKVISAVHRNEKTPRFWHVYSEQQIEACKELCLALIQTSNKKITQILGHDEISVGRKQDPGPAFPMDRFRNMLLHNDRESDVDEIRPVFQNGKVNTLSLNIREGAGVTYQPVAKALPQNQKVKVCGERNGWYRVKVEVEGWVSKSHVVQDT